MAALQKEFQSGSPRKIIKAVKSPSPSRRAVVEGRGPLETVPPPFKDVRFQSQVVLQQSAAVALSEEEFEDWEPQVGPTVLLSPPFLTPFGFSPPPPSHATPPVSQKLLFNHLSSSRLGLSSLQVLSPAAFPPSCQKQPFIRLVPLLCPVANAVVSPLQEASSVPKAVQEPAVPPTLIAVSANQCKLCPLSQ